MSDRNGQENKQSFRPVQFYAAKSERQKFVRQKDRGGVVRENEFVREKKAQGCNLWSRP